MTRNFPSERYLCITDIKLEAVEHIENHVVKDDKWLNARDTLTKSSLISCSVRFLCWKQRQRKQTPKYVLTIQCVTISGWGFMIDNINVKALRMGVMASICLDYPVHLTFPWTSYALRNKVSEERSLAFEFA